jgi:hypothetical protein
VWYNTGGHLFCTWRGTCLSPGEGKDKKNGEARRERGEEPGGEVAAGSNAILAVVFLVIGLGDVFE